MRFCLHDYYRSAQNMLKSNYIKYCVWCIVNSMIVKNDDFCVIYSHFWTFIAIGGGRYCQTKTNKTPESKRFEVFVDIPEASIFQKKCSNTSWKNQLLVEDLARKHGPSLDGHHSLGTSSRQRNVRKNTLKLK